ncbi:MFS transporter, partial [Clostridium perfringens]
IGSIALGSIAKSTSYTIMYRYSAIALVLLILIYIVMQATGKSRTKATSKLEDTEPTVAG